LGLSLHASENPNGIPSQSPGLRGTSYPGSPSANHFQPQRGCGSLQTATIVSFIAPHSPQPRCGCFPFCGLPNVAAWPERWAGGQCPVGAF
jgi:hypothetical protein